MQRRNYISESHNEKCIVLAGINVCIKELWGSLNFKYCQNFLLELTLLFRINVAGYPE